MVEAYVMHYRVGLYATVVLTCVASYVSCLSAV